MNSQETQLLQDFLEQLVRVKGVVKDPQADALIARALSQQPDAAYLLVQRALLQDQALATAKEQIATLQNELQAVQSAGSSSFLNTANLWGNSGAGGTRPAAAAPAAPAQAYQAPAPQGFLQGGAGSFLGSMAATAAGVAGGALLFQGIENLLGHHSGTGQTSRHGLASLPEESVRHDALNPLVSADNSHLAADAGLDSIDADFGNGDGGLSDV